MSGWVIWVTGMPGSGKSTLARLVARRLYRRHVAAQVLSVEMVREVLTPRPRYTEDERHVVYSTLVFVSTMLARNDVNVIIDATANRRRYRDEARRRITRFAEIYLKCPLEVCMQREKGRKRRFGAPSRIYAKARTGASKTVPGVGVPYEIPHSAELTVDTSLLRPNQSAEQISQFVLSRFCYRNRRSTAKR
ncbi:MAG: adenylyl-sulfate kinase [Candidatus Methanoperedens sp.]|nr:adenylyl-sulfate kinase [Candidatus Methanoperedens sp.]